MYISPPPGKKNELFRNLRGQRLQYDPPVWDNECEHRHETMHFLPAPAAPNSSPPPGATLPNTIPNTIGTTGKSLLRSNQPTTPNDRQVATSNNEYRTAKLPTTAAASISGNRMGFGIADTRIQTRLPKLPSKSRKRLATNRLANNP